MRHDHHDGSLAAADLLQAALGLASDLDLPTVLHRFVAASADLTGARFGAINVLDDAILPMEPNEDNTISASLQAALIGILLGMFCIVAFNVLSPKIKSARDLEAGFQLTTMGEIPHIKKMAKRSNMLLIYFYYPNKDISIA